VLDRLPIQRDEEVDAVHEGPDSLRPHAQFGRIAPPADAGLVLLVGVHMVPLALEEADEEMLDGLDPLPGSPAQDDADLTGEGALDTGHTDSFRNTEEYYTCSGMARPLAPSWECGADSPVGQCR